VAENIIAAEDALERMEVPGEDPKARSGVLEKIGQNISNSSIFGVNKKQQKIDPQLKSAEKSRLKNKMDIIVESWFKLKKKYVADDKGKTLVGKVAEDADPAKELSKDGKKQGKGLLAWLMGLLAMFGLGKTGLGRSLFKVIGGWLWKSLKWIGGKVWGFIKWGLRKGWGLLKGIFAGVWKAIKGLGRSAWKLLKGAISGIGRFFGNLWKGFKNLPVWKAFSGAIASGVNAVKGIFTSAKNTIVNALKSVGNFFKSALQKIPGIGKIFPALAKTAGGGAAGAAGAAGATPSRKPPRPRSVLGKLWDAGKSVVKKVGGGISYVAKKGVQAVKFVGKLAGAPLRAAWGLLSKWFKGPGKKLLGGVLKRVPIIGPIIEGAFAAYDIKKYAEDPEGSMEDLKQQIGERVVRGLTGVAAGAALAAALGAFTGPIGGFLGYLGGDIIGRAVGGMLAKQFNLTGLGGLVLSAFPSLTEAKMRAIDTKAAGQNKEMQDFVWRSGSDRPYTFTSKDTVLGMKKGGAISQLLNRSASSVKPGVMIKLLTSRFHEKKDQFISSVVKQDEISAKLAKLQISAIGLSNKYLGQLVQLTEILVKKPAGAAGGSAIPNVPLPQNNDMQGDMSGPTYTDNRSNYYSSPYNMHSPAVAT